MCLTVLPIALSVWYSSVLSFFCMPQMQTTLRLSIPFPWKSVQLKKLKHAAAEVIIFIQDLLERYVKDMRFWVLTSHSSQNDLLLNNLLLKPVGCANNDIIIPGLVRLIQQLLLYCGSLHVPYSSISNLLALSNFPVQEKCSCIIRMLLWLPLQHRMQRAPHWHSCITARKLKKNIGPEVNITGYTVPGNVKQVEKAGNSDCVKVIK